MSISIKVRVILGNNKMAELDSVYLKKQSATSTLCDIESLRNL